MWRAEFPTGPFGVQIRRAVMKVAILRKRFFDTAVADILRAMDGHALVGATTLSVCVIDHLAYLRAPGETNRSEYKAVVRDFLKKKTNPNYKPEWIYALRCALVHTYANSGAMTGANLSGYTLKHLDPAFHLSGSDSILRLNVESFVTDVVWAAWLFFASLKDSSKVQKKGDKLLVVQLSDSEASKPFKKMHQALRELDKDSPNYDDLYADIAAILDSYPGGAPRGTADRLVVDTATDHSLTGTSGSIPESPASRAADGERPEKK